MNHIEKARKLRSIMEQAACSQDNAPALWEDIAYRDGFRIIPETITATLAFSMGEYGWWGDRLYESLIDGNVYTPDVYPQGWEIAGGIAGEGM